MQVQNAAGCCGRIIVLDNPSDLTPEVKISRMRKIDIRELPARLLLIGEDLILQALTFSART